MFGHSHFQNVRTKLVLSILNIWIEVLRLNQNFCAKVLLWNPKRLNASVALKPVCLRQSLSLKPKLFKQKFCFAFNQNAWRKVFLWMQLFWTILLLEKTKKQSEAISVLVRKSDPEKDYPHLVSELSKILGKKTYFVQKLILHLNLKGNKEYHTTIKTGQKSSTQKYSDKTLNFLQEYIKKNPQWSPSKKSQNIIK